MQVSDPPIIVEQTFHVSINRLWKAVTNLEEMRSWFFENIEAFEAEVGFKTQFKVQSQERTFTHLWKIIEVIPFKKIVYNWKYEEYPGDSFVTFELFKEGNETRLKLTTKVIEDFPEDIPEFKLESCKQGWKYFIQQQLKNYIVSNS